MSAEAANYQCEVCSLHYRTPQHAEACKAYCAANNACNLEIIKYAIENEQVGNES